MALTKISTGMLKQDAASSDLNIDAGTLYIDVSNNRVGVANTSPTQALDVTGAIQTDTSFRAYDSVNTAYRNVLRYDGGNVRLETGTGSSASEIGMWTAGSERMRIDADGNVGIGITGPAAYGKLVVSGTGNIFNVRASSGASRIGLFEGGTGRFYIDTLNGSDGIAFVDGDGTSERMRIDSSGNVVINKDGFSSLPTGSKLNIFGDGITLRLDGSSQTTKSILFRQTSVANPGEVYADGSLRFRTEDASTRITFHTNSSGSDNERMRIDSSGNVGIGTASPETNLHIEDSSSFSIIRLVSSTTENAGIDFGDPDDRDIGRVRYNNSDNSMVFHTNAAEQMRITSGGNVGIGTTSPSAVLDIQTPNAGSDLRLTATDGSSGASARFTTAAGNFYVGLDTSTGGSFGAANHAVLWHDSAYGITFATNNSRRMTIDSSGNLLVGTTDNNVTNNSGPASQAGINIGTAGIKGLMAAARYQGAPLALNRLNNDGIIADFSKDGSTVGSIGTESSGLLIGSGNVGVRFIDSGQDRIIPRKTTLTNADAAIDLGDSGSRFRDLYLSGTANADDGVNVLSTGTMIKHDYQNGGQYVQEISADDRLLTLSSKSEDSNAGIVFKLHDVEKARFNNSGALLVGGTNDNPAGANVAGHALGASGYISTTRDGGFAAFLNRKTSDGEIVRFGKDGSTVGSIGTLSSRIYVGSDDTSIFFDSLRNALVPHNPSTNAARDAAINLGRDVVRFKDLYLSGAVRSADYRSEGVLFLTYDADDSLRIRRDNGAEAARFDSSGNLLVGTTSSTYGTSGRGVLEVNGSSSSIVAIKVNNNQAGYLFHDGTTLELWNAVAGNIRFATNGTERMHLDSTGTFTHNNNGQIHTKREHFTQGNSTLTAVDMGKDANSIMPYRGFSDLGTLSMRGFATYIDFKTNYTADNLMFLFRFEGYLYNRGNSVFLGGGYTYSSTVIAKDIGSANALTGPAYVYDLYRASDGALCVKIYNNAAGYDEGKVNVSLFSFGQLPTFRIVAARVTNSTTNYY